MAVEVRPATHDDVSAIQRVARAAWETAHEPIVGAPAVESFLAEHYDDAAFERRLNQASAVFAVADDGGPRGFAFATPDDEDDDLFHLSMLYVTPDRWGEGIGRRLLSHVETEVTALGAARLRLGVVAENDRAVDFYEVAGFEFVDEFYDDRLGVTSNIYEKALTNQGSSDHPYDIYTRLVWNQVHRSSERG